MNVYLARKRRLKAGENTNLPRRLPCGAFLRKERMCERRKESERNRHGSLLFSGLNSSLTEVSLYFDRHEARPRGQAMAWQWPWCLSTFVCIFFCGAVVSELCPRHSHKLNYSLVHWTALKLRPSTSPRMSSGLSLLSSPIFHPSTLAAQLHRFSFIHPSFHPTSRSSLHFIGPHSL